MYLLSDVQRRGVGDRSMRDFLAWAGDMPMRLWVTDYNDRAIRFYERYGFRTTGERQLWRGRLPNVRMTRDGLTPASPRPEGVGKIVRQFVEVVSGTDRAPE